MENYDIYKLKHAGLTNGQVLNVLRYSESMKRSFHCVILRWFQNAVILPCLWNAISKLTTIFKEIL